MSERVFKLQRDKEDNRDYIFKSVNAAALPDSVDLRPNDFYEIFDQGWLGSCTGNAIAALKEYNDHRDNPSGYYHYLSPNFLYWKEREAISSIDYDSGAYLRDGMKILQQVGICGMSFYPKENNLFRTEPSADAMENAGLHKITEYWRLIGLPMLKESLASGQPVVMGMDVFENFETHEMATTGYLTMPDRVNDLYRGGHAVLAVGYKDGYIIVRNSWGREWGDKGYFYMPEDYVNYYVSDMWTGV